MFGFVVGTVCLIALARTIRRARWHAYHRHSWGGYGSSTGYGSEGWRQTQKRWALKWIFRKLDTTAGQEKAVSNAWDRVQLIVEKAREELRQSQRELAELMRQDTVSEASFESMFARQEAVVDSLRKALSESLVEVHSALDARQRALLAEMIANPWAHAYEGRCGGYARHHHHHHEAAYV